MTHQTKQLRGINLGGWLVVEKWMTPSLFEGLSAEDEFTLSTHKEGRKRIRRHRKTFITEGDIKRIAQLGFELVRIPVGFWLFTKSEPYISGTKELDNCLRWCQKYGLKFIIDLHGAVKSQNGNDHSGKIGEAGFSIDENARDETIEILKKIAEKYGHAPGLWGIQLLNEPHIDGRYRILKKWYRQAYAAIDDLLAEDCKIIFSDGFRPRMTNGTLRGRRAVMDIHHYQFATKYRVFSRLSMLLYKWRLIRRKRLFGRLSKTQPIIIGEWSGVLGHELLEREKIDETTYRERWLPWHINRQMEVFNSAAATCYWSYKTEDETSVWNYSSTLAD